MGIKRRISVLRRMFTGLLRHPLPSDKKDLLHGAGQDVDGEKKKEGNSLGYSAASYDQFNWVSLTSQLTYQNVNYLTRLALLQRGISSQDVNAKLDREFVQTAIVNDGKNKNEGLRDTILRFLGREDLGDNAKITILMCDGRPDYLGRIDGGSHWTALHLRKVGNYIFPYHANSLGRGVARAVLEVLDSIKYVAKEDLQEEIEIPQSQGGGKVIALSDLNQRAFDNLARVEFKPINVLSSQQQRNVFDCGLFAVYNGIVMDFIDEDSLGFFADNENANLEVRDISAERFARHNRAILMKEFPAQEISGDIEGDAKNVVHYLLNYDKAGVRKPTSGGKTIYNDLDLAGKAFTVLANSNPLDKRGEVDFLRKLGAICNLRQRYFDGGLGEDSAKMIAIFQQLDFDGEMKKVIEGFVKNIEEKEIDAQGGCLKSGVDKQELLGAISSEKFMEALFKRVKLSVEVGFNYYEDQEKPLYEFICGFSGEKINLKLLRDLDKMLKKAAPELFSPPEVAVAPSGDGLGKRVANVEA